jgi:anti-sigma factor RsiW
MTSPCRRSAALLEPFVDGELSSDKICEVETHLADCRTCRERVRLSNAMRTSLREVVRKDAVPSSDFADRVSRALAAESVRQERASSSRWNDRGRPLAWRFIVPVAAAAGVTLVWGAAQYNHSQSNETASVNRPGMVTSTPVVTAAMDELIDEFVSYHASPSNDPPEVTEPSLVRKLEPEVGVPMPVPSLQQYGLRWEGASVVPMREKSQHAASLRYNFDGHRVTLYVYNSSRFPLRATLEPRVVRNVPVYVGSRRGYSIAAVEKRGVGYALATDLDDTESAELVVASMR